MTFDDIAIDISNRQYAQPGETTVEEVLRRAADVVAPIKGQGFSDAMYSAMVEKRFSPGGRILAGAGTEHGNLLNCFVQDGSPYAPGTTPYALNLALKLALVTRVGGGNGVNLDSFDPAQRYGGYTGTPYLLGHTPDVKSGTFLDLVTGERVTRGYNSLLVVDAIPPDHNGITLTVEDDTQSIWESAWVMVEQLMYGEDVYIDLRKLRPEGSPVTGSGGTSSGPASFAVEIFDNFARWASLGGARFAGPVATLRYLFAPTLRVIRQGGVRRGAGMATLSAGHPDLEDFLTAKTLERERLEGDISTFNISVLANDEFMLRGDRLGPIAAQAWATGEPGLLFVDTINAHNMLADTHGPILATNPCGEIPLYPGEPCDLGAVNLSEYVGPTGQPEYERVEQDAYRYAAYLDAILDVENSPLPEIADAIKSKRRIGLGIMGLADALIKMGVRYGTYDAAKVAWEFASAIRRGALLYSSDAATWFGNPSDLADFRPARRNVALLTVAPTGTTAMVMGTTSGIEPLFAPFIYRRVGTEYKQILHPLFKASMERHTPSPVYARWVENAEGAWIQNGWDWDRITQAISNNHGSVQGLSGIPKEVRDVFHCAHDIDSREHVHMQGVVQNAFDFHGDDFYARSDDKTYAGNSISKTINLPQSATVEDVEDIYKLAWRLGLKGMTVYRDGSRDLQVLNTTMEDDGSTRASQAQDEQLQEIVAATCSLDGSCDV